MSVELIGYVGHFNVSETIRRTIGALDPGFIEAAAKAQEMDNAAQTQLLAEAAGTPTLIDPATAALSASQVARPRSGLLILQPVWELVVAQEPDLLD